MSNLTMRDLDDLKISFNDVTIEQITIGRAEVCISLSFLFYFFGYVSYDNMSNIFFVFMKIGYQYIESFLCDIVCINQWSFRSACKEAGRINCKTLLRKELLASLDPCLITFIYFMCLLI